MSHPTPDEYAHEIAEAFEARGVFMGEDEREMIRDALTPPPSPSPSEQLLRYFSYEHLPADLQEISRPLCQLAVFMDGQLPDGPEKTTGLRKLLEAKDAFVRAALPPLDEG